MKPSLFFIGAFAILFLSAFTTYQSINNWKVAEDYAIKFTSKNPSGIFKTLSGEILFDENDLDASSFNMTIDAASISTGNGMKNKHAKGSKWFDVKQYPEIKFNSSKITKTDTGYETTGILDMHGVQKEITIPFTFSDNIFSGTFKINRFDYKLGGTKGPQGKAAEELEVDISVPVTK